MNGSSISPSPRQLLGRYSLKWDSDITDEYPKVTRFYCRGANLPTAKEFPVVTKRGKQIFYGYLQQNSAGIKNAMF